EDRRPAHLARAVSAVAAGHHLQRRGEPAHALHQRSHRLRTHRLRGRMAEGPDMTLTNDRATLTIAEMTVPMRVDDAEAADFHALVALNNAVCESDTGVTDLSRTAEEM